MAEAFVAVLAVESRSDTRDHSDRLYALDILPVADEDTGTDLYLTIRAAAKSAAENETTDGGELLPGAIGAVSTNYAKKYRFSLEKRLSMARESPSYLRGRSAEPMGYGLLVEYCRSHGTGAVVRG